MIYLITGVTASGKSTVAKLLAQKLKCRLHDANEYFSDQEAQKIAQGITLTVEEWKGWIFAVRSVVDMELAQKEDFVIACSAIKEKYRETITGERKNIKVVFLKADKETLLSRLSGLGHHKTRKQFLEWELKELEEPKKALILDASLPPEKLVEMILN